MHVISSQLFEYDTFNSFQNVTQTDDVLLLSRLHGAGPGLPVDGGQGGQHRQVYQHGVMVMTPSMMTQYDDTYNVTMTPSMMTHCSDMKLSQFDLISTPTGNETVSLNHGE